MNLDRISGLILSTSATEGDIEIVEKRLNIILPIS